MSSAVNVKQKIISKMEKRKENLVFVNISLNPSRNIGLNKPFEDEVDPDLRISPTTGILKPFELLEEVENSNCCQLRVSPTSGILKAYEEVQNPDDIVCDDDLNILHKRTLKPLTRKRQADSSSWVCNKRKKCREEGKDYVDIKGNIHEARKVKETCTCRMKCFEKICQDERQEIHNNFWKLSDKDKSFFYSKYVTRTVKKRTRTKSNKSKKKNSFFFYFELNGNVIKVCKKFFLNTLDISQSRITYCFKYMNSTGTPRPLIKGRNKKKIVREKVKDDIRKHIMSFPLVDSHYCRSNTQKKYLESTLNLKSMYVLYCESVEIPAKEHVYRNIFINEFNLSFHKPKKDRCDTCEKYKLLTSPSEEETLVHNNHIALKNRSRDEKSKDKLCENNYTVISFDLENVFCLPRSEVSNFFYKRKYSVYNLTAYCSNNKKAYNALWHEGLSGRAGNDIACALIKILENVLFDLPNMEKIVLWSDACVPQNRNQIMSTALKYFIKNHPNIKEISQKYSEPGHGTIQEVDAVHSKIERFIKNTEIFSPLGLLRQLKVLSNKSKGNLEIIQMTQSDYVNYQNAAKYFNYSVIPYTQIKQSTLLSSTPFHVSYKKTFDSNNETVSILKTTRNRKESQSVNYPKLSLTTTFPKISADKKKDLISMYQYMPQVDMNFYQAILK